MKACLTMALLGLTGCHLASYREDGRPMAQASLLWDVKEQKPATDPIAAISGAVGSWITGSMWPGVVGVVPRDAGALLRSPATAVENLTTTSQQVKQDPGSGQLPEETTLRRVQ